MTADPTPRERAVEALLDAGSRCCGSDEEICDDCRAVAAKYLDTLLPILFEPTGRTLNTAAWMSVKHIDGEGAVMSALAAQRKEFER